MARKSKEAEKAYQAEYYRKRMASKEAREEKNAKQREYLRRMGYKPNKEYDKKTYKQYAVNFKKVEDAEIISLIEAEKAKGFGTTEAIKNLIGFDSETEG